MAYLLDVPEFADDTYFHSVPASLSKDQKAALLTCFILVLASDGKPNTLEENELKKVYGVFQINHLIKQEVEAHIINDFYLIVEQLKTLTKQQKDWFILLLNHLILSDGDSNQTELASAIKFIEAAEIIDLTIYASSLIDAGFLRDLLKIS